MSGPASILVAEYNYRLLAKKMGFTTDLGEVTDFEMSYFTECFLEYESLKNKDIEKARKKK